LLQIRCTFCDDGGFCNSYDKDLIAKGNSDPEKSKKGVDTGSIVGITLSLDIAGI
jgi:hypothetical protein